MRCKLTGQVVEITLQELIIILYQVLLVEQEQEQDQVSLERLQVQMLEDNHLVIVLLIYLSYHLFVQEILRLVAQD